MGDDRMSVSIRLDDIIQEYPKADGGTNRVIDGVTFAIEKPGIVMLLGPSGCGKSTLLRMMGGVRPHGTQTPTSGRVSIDGQDCTGPHDDAVMVFQQYANRPDLSIRRNVAFPFQLALWRSKSTAAEQKERVDRVLEAVGLADKQNLKPWQLSGGQNQRVALARALVLRPRILLMDEPFGALDAQTREGMQQLLVSLYNENPCAVVFVTHDVTEALLLGDRVVVLSAGPAKVVADFEIAEARPRSQTWQRSTEAQKFEEEILTHLRAGGGHGQVRVTV
jgi:ABC-type nitrate/sulfonate/bicarbonate transport system ATPase subunit